MTSRYYNTLFVDGDFLQLGWFRMNFFSAMVDADPQVFFQEYVNNAGRRIPMYTFRTPDEPRLDLLASMSWRWPSLRFVLFHDTLGEEACSGFVVYERGRRMHCWASAATAEGTIHAPPADQPSHKLYGRHRISPMEFEKRMKWCGVMPDDPLPGYGEEGDGLAW